LKIDVPEENERGKHREHKMNIFISKVGGRFLESQKISEVYTGYMFTINGC
jgi:hypothetical protein